jgi:hypothetical protein
MDKKLSSPLLHKCLSSANKSVENYNMYIHSRPGWPGWPDWTNFRPLGDCLLWAVFLNDQSSPHFGLLFPTVKVMQYFWQKLGVLHFFTNSSGHPVRDWHSFTLLQMWNQSSTYICKNINLLNRSDGSKFVDRHEVSVVPINPPSHNETSWLWWVTVISQFSSAAEKSSHGECFQVTPRQCDHMRLCTKIAQKVAQFVFCQTKYIFSSWKIVV